MHLARGLRAGKGQRSFKDHFTKGETEATEDERVPAQTSRGGGVGGLQGGSRGGGAAQNPRPLKFALSPPWGTMTSHAGSGGCDQELWESHSETRAWEPRVALTSRRTPSKPTLRASGTRPGAPRRRRLGVPPPARPATAPRCPRLADPWTSLTENARGTNSMRMCARDLSFKAGGAASLPIGIFLPAWPRLIRQASGVPLSPG